MPEISAPGFYKRNFPLPRKAFRDTRWKSAIRESGMEVGQIAVFLANMETDVFFSDQQQFISSLKAAPYSAKGEDVIFVLGFDKGKKSSFKGAKEVSPCPAPVVASPGAGSPENIQSDMKVTVEEGSNKCRKPLNAEIIPGEENINSKILLPKSISAAELFDIQIKEINEALIKFGKQMDGEIKAKEASNAEITPQNQCDEAKEGSGARETKITLRHCFKKKIGQGLECIQDCQGRAWHKVETIPLPLTVVELETLATSKSLQFATDLSLSDVIPKGDSEIVINALNAN
nr:hypothetical protein CFP56_57168 [Quercus suber]